MSYSWKVTLTVCWAATFVAMLADEISEHVSVDGWIYFASLVVFGISMVVAFVAGCLATAALLNTRRKNKTP